MTSWTRTQRRLHLLIVEATSGVTFSFGVVISAVALMLAAVLSTSEMLPGWADPLNLTLTSSMIFAPISGGAGVMVAGRLKRSGTLALAATAPQGRWRALGHATLAAYVWLVIGFALFSGAVLAIADRSGPLSRAMWLLPTQGLILIAACLVIGVAVGARTTWFLTGPVLALAIYVSLFRLDVSGSRLSPVYTDIYYQVWLEPNARLVIAVSLVLLATAAGVVGFALHLSGWGCQTAAGVTALGCLIVAITQFHFAGPRRHPTARCSTRHLWSP